MSKRQRREEIIWYGIVYKGQSKIIFLYNKVNTLKYSDFSTNHQQLYFWQIPKKYFIFYQNNALFILIVSYSNDLKQIPHYIRIY